MKDQSYSALGLRIFGNDLDPGEISRLLGALPSSSYRKGERFSTGGRLIRKTNAWIRDATDRRPDDLNSQIAEILDPLCQDLGVWAHLQARFQLDLFAGLFMEEGYPGFTLSANAISLMAARGLQLRACVYGTDTLDRQPPDPHL